MENRYIFDIVGRLPIRTKLWCDLLGEVYYLGTTDDLITVKGVYNGFIETVTEYGTFYRNDNTPCILWPSKNHRTWEDWECVLKPYKVNDFLTFNSGVNARVVEFLKDGYVKLLATNGKELVIPIEELETAHKWSVKDCVKGDLLTNGIDKVMFSEMLEDNKFKALVSTYGLVLNFNTIEECDNYKPLERCEQFEFYRNLADCGFGYCPEEFAIKPISEQTILINKEFGFSVQVIYVDDYGYGVDGCGFEGVITPDNMVYWKVK